MVCMDGKADDDMVCMDVGHVWPSSSTAVLVLLDENVLAKICSSNSQMVHDF